MNKTAWKREEAVRKTISEGIIVLLVFSVFPLASTVQPVKALGETVYIRGNGLVEPSDAPILNVGNVSYTFTGNINASLAVERDNIVVDGAEYTLLGNGTGNGISLNQRSNVTIKNITIEAFEYGIYLSNSFSNTLSANRIVNNTHGILVNSSSGNILSANNLTNNSYSGLCFYYSGNNVLRNNLMIGNRGNSYFAGYSLSDFLNDVDTSNMVDGKPIYYWVNRTSQTIPADAGCVVLVNSTQITVQDLNLLNNGQGVLLAYTSASTIRRNNLTSGIDGLDMYCSTNNTLSANSLASNSNYSLYFSSSSNNSVSANNVTNNGHGILLSASSSNSISANNIIDNRASGIYLDSSSNSNSITRNTITNSGDNEIEIFLSSSNSISANNITGSKTYDGIRLVLSSGNRISANTITNNEYGVLLVSSSGNRISANTITNNFHGINLYDCSNNSVYANIVTNNKIGIYPYHSPSNGISANNITNNELGIALASSYNLIWHNNFVDNTAQAYVAFGYMDVWDYGYPSGGNYWSNYAGADLYTGPHQNVTGSDGIGDAQCVIDADNIDHYPLMTPWVPTLELSDVTSWYWTSSTAVNSVVVGDVDGDGQKETVTGGTFYDGTRIVAQLVVWNSSSLAPERFTAWYWFSNTTINSIALGDVNGDGQAEIVTGGYYYDGARQVAQLVVWNGSSLAVEGVRTWYWTNNTVINSVALGNVDGDAQVEIVTGGFYNDGTRNIAQLVIWAGSDLSVDKLTTWYWTGNTIIDSVAIGDVDGDGQVEIVTGGYYNDGTRNVAQLVVWTGSGLAVGRLTAWYWTNNTVINSVAIGDVDADGQTEIVTAGYYNDGIRNVAQLVVWAGSALTVERLTSWYWTGNTVINSVALGDMDNNGQKEIVTGGYYNDGTRNVAQMVAWSGSSLAVENIRTWYWFNDAPINSVCLSDVNGDLSAEIVTGGAYHDGLRWVAQLVVWGM